MNRNHPNDDGNTKAALQVKMIHASHSAADIHIAGCTDDNALPETELLSHLSDSEQTKVQSLTDPAERRHLLFRRCFQRLFLAKEIDWPGRIRDLYIEHKLDRPPRLPCDPSVKFSFSSSGASVVACASRKQVVGIDIEKIRPVADPIGLSNRFFTPPEAATLERMAENARSLAFLHYWTAKEAGLKAVGKGIDSGLNSFVVSEIDGSYVVEYNIKKPCGFTWNLQHLEFPEGHIVAFIHRPVSS
jgi:4'-phosphopantetheinyl transferase